MEMMPQPKNNFPAYSEKYPHTEILPEAREQMDNKVGFLPMTFVLMASIGLMNHVIIIPILLGGAKRDAWLAILCNIVPFMIWIGLLAFIIRSSAQRFILDWVQDHCGSWAMQALRVIMIVYLFVAAFVTFKDTIDWTVNSYLQGTPAFLLGAILIIVCYYAARSGMQSITVAAGILVPVIIVLGFFVSSANLQHKDYARLLPVLEFGAMPVLKGMFDSGVGLVELFIIVLLQHRVHTRIRYWHLLVVGLIMIGLTLGPTMGAIAEFGPVESARQRYPAFEQWKLVRIGNYIEHVDFFSIYQWLAGAAVRIATFMFLIGELLWPASWGNEPQGKWKVLPVGILLAIGLLIPFTEIRFFRFLYTYYFPGSFGLLLLVSLALGIAAIMKRRGENDGQHPERNPIA